MPWLSCIASNVLLAALLALAAWLVERYFKLPAVARVLWVLVLVKLITPPLVTLPLGKSFGASPPSSSACALGECNCERHQPAQALPRSAIRWTLFFIWSAGSIATLLIASRRWARFRRLLNHARPASPEWQALAVRFASELSLRRSPEILVVPGRLPPLVVPRLGRACLLLPRELLGQLSDSQKPALVLHELIHLQRRDHWVRVLELFVGAAYWWLPFAGLIGRRLRTCEERSCDAAVAAHLPNARRDYARLLLDVFDFANPLPLQTVPHATAMSVACDLEQRLQAILDTQDSTRRVWPTGMLAATLACAVLPCQLDYRLVVENSSQQLAPAATAVEGKPAASETPSTARTRHAEVISVFCCPT